MGDQTDRQILYQLVGSVGQLKAECHALAESQRNARDSLASVQSMLTELGQNVERAIAHESRLVIVERSMTDYNTIKNRVLGMVIGAGMGSGAAGWAIAAWVAKTFGAN